MAKVTIVGGWPNSGQEKGGEYMRLIDADALKEEIEFQPTSVSVCATVVEAKGQTYFKNRCLDDIDNAPTIPAIPVEWLENQADNAPNKVWEAAIDYLLILWRNGGEGVRCKISKC